MWNRITSISQIRKLQADSELLYEQRSSNSDGKDQPETEVYKLKKIDGDTVILYQSGHHEGRPFYASRGFLLEELMNGQWLVRND